MKYTLTFNKLPNLWNCCHALRYSAPVLCVEDILVHTGFVRVLVVVYMICRLFKKIKKFILDLRTSV